MWDIVSDGIMRKFTEYMVIATLALDTVLLGSCSIIELKKGSDVYNIEEYCISNIFSQCQERIWQFHNYLIDGRDSVFFEQTTDSTWRSTYFYDIKCMEFWTSNMFTLTEDSTVVFTLDGYNTEEDYVTHVFTVGRGIVNNNGTIRVEVSHLGIPWGWAEIYLSGDFWNGNWQNSKFLSIGNIDELVKTGVY